VTDVLRPDLITAMFSAYGVRGVWQPLTFTGIANWIYATDDVVLRVATDHRDGVPDARTESVAAPAAYAAGILTPRMLAFDDTRTLVDRPFSLWDRVRGATLGQVTLSDSAQVMVWQSVGRELARLHRLVTACPDPQGYLDTPGDEPDVDRLLATLVATGRLDAAAARDVRAVCSEVEDTPRDTTVAFTHGDMHWMNVMCDETGRLLAIIDWGDAGWKDPMADFASMPLDAIPSAVAGYEAETGETLSGAARARLVRFKAISALDHFVRHPDRVLDDEALRRFVTKGA